MEFIDQIQNPRIVTETIPRTFLRWDNTEYGRDTNDCYERIDRGGSFVSWVNQNNTSMALYPCDKFFHVLEEIYKTALKNQ